MQMKVNRRNLIKSLGLLPFLGTGTYLASNPANNSSPRVRCSVNAYSFNDQFRGGEMTLADMMEFAADIGLDAVDLTGYYFASYPEVPPDQELFKMKRLALRLGLDISWTGVRNNFANPDASARAKDIQHIKEWLEASSKVGAPIMRIFAGRGDRDGFSREEVKEWMAKDLRACAELGSKTGVLPAMQHHNDFLFTSDEVIDMLKSVNSDWLGLILDVGSLRTGDPYEEIDKLAPYADYWFIKELVYKEGEPEPVNMDKLSKILHRHKYTGYVSFESLTDGDPKEIVADMHTSFRKSYEKITS